MTVFNSQVIGILAVGLAILSNALEWEGQLVFEENFDGDSLDLNKWEYQEACGNRNATLHFKLCNVLNYYLSNFSPIFQNLEEIVFSATREIMWPSPVEI